MTGTEGSSGHEVQLPEAEYILPLRWFSDEGLDELTGYLRMLSGWIRITVVDGSAPELYKVHAAAWAGLVEHRRPEVWPGRNGKVAGVMTGVRHSRKEYLVLADDDVRYTLPALRRLVALLSGADVVRPQNYFLTLPWHARWDTARTLLNRAVASDFPGTLGVRRSALDATDGYDGDVLFENLELIRTVKAAGGRELRADDLFVGRIPATAAHFRGQRVRQAYDDFAQPVRLAVELTLLPLMIFAARRPALATAEKRARCLPADLGAVDAVLAARTRRLHLAGVGPAAGRWREIRRQPDAHGGHAPLPTAAEVCRPTIAAHPITAPAPGPGKELPMQPAEPIESTEPTCNTADTDENAGTSGSPCSPAHPDNVLVACPDGPFLLRGDVEIVTPDGELVPRRRKTVALCRCGASSIKPYCDGTHKLIGFTTAVGTAGHSSPEA
jgi:CDGSH-type Zn-finger protein